MLHIRLFETPRDVGSRLAQLDLEESLLSEALRQANLYRVRLTEHHPRLYRYQVMSGETIAALRDQLVPMGWSKSDGGNYELTVNEKATVAIAVASGDHGTGNPNRTPSNRSPKGRHTIAAIEANRQADMFAELLPTRSLQEKPLDTWVLLHHVKSDKIEAELSRPKEIDIDGKIISWSERILLSPIPLDGEPITILPPELPDIDIPISRKAA